MVPAVTTLSPTAGPVAGTNVVTVTGSGFVIGATSVSFGSTPGTGVVVSGPTSLTVTAPVGTAGPVNLTVTTPGGTSTAVTYTYNAVPAVTTLSPTAGPVAGTNVVTVTARAS
ncbi:MAG: IPT/TIG domain-containing protein [Aliidongia sp.]